MYNDNVCLAGSMTETTLRNLIEKSLWYRHWYKCLDYIDNITKFEDEAIKSESQGLVVVMKDRRMYHITVKRVQYDGY